MVTECSDYIDELQKIYPEWSKSELKLIIIYGLRILDYSIAHRADITLHKRDDDPIVIHFGDLGLDTLTHYNRWVKLYQMKERVLWRLKKNIPDDYYYIGLTQKQHEKILKQHKKEKVFTKVFPVRIMKEIYHDKTKKHIWRIKYPINCGFKFYAEKLTTTTAEYIGENLYGKYHKCFHGRDNIGHASTDNEG